MSTPPLDSYDDWTNPDAPSAPSASQVSAAPDDDVPATTWQNDDWSPGDPNAAPDPETGTNVNGIATSTPATPPPTGSGKSPGYKVKGIDIARHGVEYYTTLPASATSSAAAGGAATRPAPSANFLDDNIPLGPANQWTFPSTNFGLGSADQQTLGDSFDFDPGSFPPPSSSPPPLPTLLGPSWSFDIRAPSPSATSWSLDPDPPSPATAPAINPASSPPPSSLGKIGTTSPAAADAAPPAPVAGPPAPTDPPPKLASLSAAAPLAPTAPTTATLPASAAPVGPVAPGSAASANTQPTASPSPQIQDTAEDLNRNSEPYQVQGRWVRPFVDPQTGEVGAKDILASGDYQVDPANGDIYVLTARGPQVIGKDQPTALLAQLKNQRQQMLAQSPPDPQKLAAQQAQLNDLNNQLHHWGDGVPETLAFAVRSATAALQRDPHDSAAQQQLANAQQALALFHGANQVAGRLVPDAITSPAARYLAQKGLAVAGNVAADALVHGVTGGNVIPQTGRELAERGLFDLAFPFLQGGEVPAKGSPSSPAVNSGQEPAETAAPRAPSDLSLDGNRVSGPVTNRPAPPTGNASSGTAQPSGAQQAAGLRERTGVPEPSTRPEPGGAQDSAEVPPASPIPDDGRQLDPNGTGPSPGADTPDVAGEEQLSGRANTEKWAGRGSTAHADQPGRLPEQLRQSLAATKLKFTAPGKRGQDVQVVGGKHPSEYPNSDWPPGVNFGDFKPDTPGGRKTFKSDQKYKWKEPTHQLPYDPETGQLK